MQKKFNASKIAGKKILFHLNKKCAVLEFCRPLQKSSGTIMKTFKKILFNLSSYFDLYTIL